MAQSTALKMAAEEQMDLSMMSLPMKISDAASMCRRPIAKNEPPYQAEVKRLNNARVDEWYERVLMRIADGNGSVQAGRVHGCLMYFLEGKEALSYQTYKPYLVSYSTEQVEYWINFLRTSTLKEMYEAGSGVVATGWTIIKGAVRNHFAEEKWKAVYSHSDDPLVWDKLANDNPHVMNGRPLPFGLNVDILDEINTKVSSFLQNPIEPR
jgi:hypothetical protein